jgi:oxygen-independent coproporphyrinogen-3 oxidase
LLFPASYIWKNIPVQVHSDLLQKYNRSVPRYTSYPTVPFWNDHLDIPRWKQLFHDRFAECNNADGISLYIHLPFCESLCIYCGCNKKISANHSVEEEYLQAVLKEWGMYLQIMEQPPVIREIHLGGGTPTYFSPENLKRLISGLLESSVIHPDHSFSIEGHPNNTTREHLDTLYALGFRRISYGVQDLNREVQEAIHRIQPFEYLRRATVDARAAGFTSVNFDLIYGLPLQTLSRLRHSIAASLTLQPDRLAFYSYAHTPWLNCSQRLIDEMDLPSPSDKMALYEAGKSWLVERGYTNIGMDHFALEDEELCRAWKTSRLHRNFMGYTTQASGMLLGLGVSAISDLGTAFAQNDKTLGGYYRSIGEGTLALKKGYFLSKEDQVFRRHILDIACKGSTVFDPAWTSVLEEWTLPRLRELAQDGLVSIDEESVVCDEESVTRATSVTLTTTGRAFLRHVCKAFDLHLLREEKNGAPDSIRCGKSGLNPQISYV